MAVLTGLAPASSDVTGRCIDYFYFKTKGAGLSRLPHIFAALTPMYGLLLLSTDAGLRLESVGGWWAAWDSNPKPSV